MVATWRCVPLRASALARSLRGTRFGIIAVRAGVAGYRKDSRRSGTFVGINDRHCVRLARRHIELR